MKTTEPEYKKVGALLIDLEGGEGSFVLDIEAHAWREMPPRLSNNPELPKTT
jgi:hypothetical protein|tara:strand:+ start:175 stop:330 length:156 start_codon:yes stop_codon:yes gene_type:complete